ncbi:hypothetical protein BT67DRAFT_444757 [Trichocladium antarcticum]|uniref:Uncharacterized protein n=1 Tax=Trichocladium antarcticum TaxID=1450529 RepID=A0AAN6UEQ8_9PEZI|nr:hypothetical protein BT67DRAFT_444757 [Trichocladium antarcticum]
MHTHAATTHTAPRRGGLFSSRGRRTPATTTAPRRGIFGRRQHAPVTTTTTAPRRQGLFSSRRRQRGAVTTAPVVHHHKRKTSIGDKISGALLKLKGSLTGRPGQKAAGTRRMHGTDGRGSRRRY